MTMKLASAKNDGRPLDFGLSIVFDAALGMRALGRVDSPAYIGAWFGGLTANDVNLTDVADSYQIPTPAQPAPTSGRDINRHEFLDLGMATDPAKFEAILAQMPEVSEYLDDYREVAGIKFADAALPSSSLAILLARAVTLGIITSSTVTSFMTNWVALYPAT